MRPAVVCLIVALGPSCIGQDASRPGTPLGRYRVQASLADNTCEQAQDPWVFEVDLAEDPGKIYWIQGQAPVTAAIAADGRAEFSATQTQPIHDADKAKGLGTCSLTRDDQVDIALATDRGSFSGKLSYAFHPVEGDDCHDQLTAAGGDFEQLPCSVNYQLSAAREASSK